MTLSKPVPRAVALSVLALSVLALSVLASELALAATADTAEPEPSEPAKRFLEEVESSWARFAVPPGGLTLPDALGRAAESFVGDVLALARTSAASRGEGLVRTRDVEAALEKLLPRKADDSGDATFFADFADSADSAERAESVAISAADLARFRESGMQRRILEAILESGRVEPGADPDALAAELLADGLAQYAVLALRVAGDLARDERISPFVSGRHVGWAAEEIRRLSGLPPADGGSSRADLSESDRRHYEAWGLSPDDAGAHAAYAAALAEVLSYSEAREHFETALRLDPDHLAAHFGYAKLLARVKRETEAVQHFERLVGSGTPLEAPAHENLGVILGKLGRRDEALAHFEAAVRLSPDQADFRFNLGNACYYRGRLEDAVVHLRRAVELDPKLARAHLRLGGALGALGRHREALAVYQTLLGLNHRDPVALYEIGRTFQVLEDTGKARRAFERALAQARKSYRYRDLQKRIEEQLATL